MKKYMDFTDYKIAVAIQKQISDNHTLYRNGSWKIVFRVSDNTTFMATSEQIKMHRVLGRINVALRNTLDGVRSLCPKPL